MVVCFDLDGTISADPALFGPEMRGLVTAGHQVHVLSGNPKAPQELAQLGFVPGRDYTHLAVVPRKGVSHFKVAYMRAVGASALTDNRKKNIQAARRAGFTANWHRPPKKKG